MTNLIHKPKVEVPKWQTNLFHVSLVLLVIAVLGYFIFMIFEKSSNSQRDKASEELVALEVEEDPQLVEEVLKYENKINNFKILLNEHQGVLVFLETLDNLESPNTKFIDFSLDVPSKTVNLSGITSNVQELLKQQNMFNNEELIEEFKLTDWSINNEGRLDFKYNLTIKEKAFDL